MKTQYLIPFICLFCLSPAFSQVTKPTVILEDTSLYYIQPGIMFETAQGFEMVSYVSGAGIGITRMDTNFNILSEDYSYVASILASAHQMPEGKIVVTGAARPDPTQTRLYPFAFQMDKNAKKQWGVFVVDTSQRVFGGGMGVVDQQQNVLITASLTKQGTGGAGLIKLDSSGNILWSKIHLGSTSQGNKIGIAAVGVANRPNNAGYVILANSPSTGSYTVSGTSFLIWTDIDGDSIRSTRAGTSEDFPLSLLEAPGGYYVIAEQIFSRGATIFKVDHQGNLLWTKDYKYRDVQSELRKTIPKYGYVTSDGGCIVASNVPGGFDPLNSNAPIKKGGINLLKLSPTGDNQWDMLIESPDEFTAEYIRWVMQLSDGSYVVSSRKEYIDSVSIIPYNYYARLSPDGTHVATTSVQEEVGSLTVLVSPNPFTNQVEASFTLDQPSTYTARLYDLQGRVVQETAQQAAAGAQTVRMNTSNLAAGQYVLRIQAGNAMWNGKVVKR
ncbi:MAG: T9SS type A sorting domain-containing protein [Bacteroidota bacterium]